jgi:hypothetical protein
MWKLTLGYTVFNNFSNQGRNSKYYETAWCIHIHQRLFNCTKSAPEGIVLWDK